MADLLPIALFVLASCLGFAFDRFLRSQRKDGETGSVWAHVLKWQTLIFTLLFLLSSLIKNTLPAYWEQGYHLYFDITGLGFLAMQYCYFITLTLPFSTWVALIVLHRKAENDKGKWIAGHIDTHKKRWWIFSFCVPFMFVLTYALPRIGGGQFAYPGAIWGVVATLVLSLVGIALSKESPFAVQEQPLSDEAIDENLEEWPQALKNRGIEVDAMFTWEKSNQTFKDNVTGVMATDVQRNLKFHGVKNVSPQITEAFSELLESSGDPNDPHGNSRLIFTPENCGQNEIVSIASRIMDQRFQTITLVVTPKDPEKHGELFKPWMPEGEEVAILKSGNLQVPEKSYLWVTDAETLSERLLPIFTDPVVVRRIGLVVWWNLHEYTGVSGANLWGISHRLHRVINAMGRPDIRTAVFIGKTADSSTQHAKFVRRLLPHPFGVKKEVHIEPHFFKEIRLYFLKSQRKFFRETVNRGIVGGDARYPSVIAAKVSMEEYWPTYLDDKFASKKITSEGLFQVSVSNAEGKTKVGDQLCLNSADAGVRLLDLTPSNALSLADTISQGGRTFSKNYPFHIGAPVPENPYIHYLISRLKNSDNAFAFSEGRRLVGASAHPSIIERHLIKALSEMPDTHSGLQKDFHFAEEVIDKTLDRIASEDKLERTEVRFLDGKGKLVREPQYQGKVPRDDLQRPLDTVGTKLVTVREKVGGYDDSGIRLLVDPERVLIKAYPGRVFMHNGWRYRIKNWESTDNVIAHREIACEKENDFLQTFRWKRYFFDDFHPIRNTTTFGPPGKYLAKTTVSLIYEESLKGHVELYSGEDNASSPKIKPVRIGEPINQSFPTTALILHMAKPEEEESVWHMELVSVCQALRHVLPVHVGIEENALEIVPVMGEYIGDSPVYGVGLVDLYPGSIGLIDSIEDDNALIRRLLESAYEWLKACPCSSEDGCELCLSSPASLAANYPRRPKRIQALATLEKVV